MRETVTIVEGRSVRDSLTTERLDGRKEKQGERSMDDPVTLAVRILCQGTTTTDREGESMVL